MATTNQQPDQSTGTHRRRYRLADLSRCDNVRDIRCRAGNLPTIPADKAIEPCVGETTRTARGRVQRVATGSIAGPNGPQPICAHGTHSRLWWSQRRAIPIQGGHVVLARRRPWVYLLATLAAVLAIWLVTGQNVAVNVVSYVGDVTGIVPANQDVHAQIDEYTTFQSTPDAYWNNGTAGSEVALLVSNPAGNPVDMAPHVYVDIDDDGSFSDEECVYNPMQGDGSSLDDYGSFLSPGTSLDSIVLARDVPSGTHAGKVVYSALHVDTHQLANGMTMHFNVQVG